MTDGFSVSARTVAEFLSEWHVLARSPSRPGARYRSTTSLRQSACRACSIGIHPARRRKAHSRSRPVLAPLRSWLDDVASLHKVMLAEASSVLKKFSASDPTKEKVSHPPCCVTRKALMDDAADAARAVQALAPLREKADAVSRLCVCLTFRPRRSFTDEARGCTK